MPTGTASGLDVVDVDPKNGGEGSFAALAADLGPLPETVEATSGSGGQHLYLCHHAGLRRRIAARPGIDVLGDGGYVVLPPSVHPSGRVYTWRSALKGAVVAPWPRTWLSALVAPHRPSSPTRPWAVVPTTGCATTYGRAALDRAAQALAAAGAGTRDTERNRIAFGLGRLVAAGHLARENVETALLSACSSNGLVDDLGQENVRDRIARGVDDGIAEGPRGPSVPWAPFEVAR